MRLNCISWPVIFLLVLLGAVAALVVGSKNGWIDLKGGCCAKLCSGVQAGGKAS